MGYNLDVLKANAWRDYRTENGKEMGRGTRGHLANSWDRAVVRRKQIELREDVGLMEEAFSALCNGLVELSSMPKYQQEEEVEEDILKRVTDEEDGLPMWLLGLLVCCKLEEGDEAGIRIQVKFHIFFLHIFT